LLKRSVRVCRDFRVLQTGPRTRDRTETSATNTHWSNTTPKADRLDGWIVRWGDDAKSAAKVNVWAVCMKRGGDVTTETTNY
jgi:hypothetical protein